MSTSRSSRKKKKGIVHPKLSDIKIPLHVLPPSKQVNRKEYTAQVIFLNSFPTTSKHFQCMEVPNLLLNILTNVSAVEATC